MPDPTGRPATVYGLDRRARPLGQHADVAPLRPAPDPGGGITARLLTGGAMFQLPDRDHLIDGWLALDSLAVTFAQPKNYKSFVKLDQALSVATGRDWCGHAVTPGTVIYVAAEGAYGLRARIAAWCDYHDVGHDQLERFHLLPGRVELLDRAQVDELGAVLTERHVSHLVLDTLSRCLAGGDENSPKDMGAAVEALDRLRQASGACVDVVHHAGKDRDRGMRGHSVLWGAVDTALEVTAGNNRATVTAVDQKDLPDGQAVRLRLERHAGSLVPTLDRRDAPAAGSRPESLTRIMERVSDLVIARPGIPKGEIHGAVTGKTDTVKTAVAALEADGWLDVTVAGVGKPHVCRMLRPYRAVNDPHAAEYDPTAEVPPACS